MLKNKKIWNLQFRHKKKYKKNNRLEVVEAIVLNVKKDELILKIKDGRNAKCKFTHLSDYDFEYISNRFLINSTHQFVVTKYDERNNIYLLNYKMIHPMEIKDKRRSIPTLSHDRNLRKFLKFILENKTS